MKTSLFKNKCLFLTLILLCTILLSAHALTVTITVNNQACINDGAATANISGGTPPYTVTWYGEPGQFSGNPVSNLPAGSYWVNVIDNAGNYGYASFTIGIIQLDSMQSTPDTCNQGNGTLAVYISGGTSPYIYSWSNVTHYSSLLADTNSGLLTGIQYPVVITDATGCQLQLGFPGDSMCYVGYFSPVQTTISSTLCNCNDGTATVTASNGTAPYSYIWNTTPPQTSQTAFGLDVTYYSVTVTDADGCTAMDNVGIDPGPDYIQSDAIVNNTVCPYSTGSISLIVWGGTAPYSYLWNTGQTTANISNLAAGNYICQITDFAGCMVTRHKTVYLISPININYTHLQPSCNNADGSITANVSGGTPPYSYQWSNGQTTQTATGLAQGYYWGQVTDQNNCYTDYGEPLYEPDSCYATINVKIWHDINGNCIEDAGEYGLPYVHINSIPDGINYEGTDINGQFHEMVNPGSIDISHNVPIPWTQFCPSSSIVTTNAAANNSYNIEFFDHPDSIFDNLEIYLGCSEARPGSQQQYEICYRNKGTELLNGSVTFNFDSQILFSSSYPAPSSISATTATFNYINLLPLESRNIYITCYVPATDPIGDTLYTNVAIAPIISDVHPLNNFDSCSVIVTGSYDPNYKTVSPYRDAQGAISTADSLLRYTVYFQNTGTGYAYEVKIIDTLDQNLDPASLEIISAVPSVPQVNVNGRVITFDFVPIYLSDSISYPEGSHGFVSFHVKQNPSLTIGTEIRNTAYIYFDFNSPIATNQTLNTITSVSYVPEVYQPISGINVFPNPVRNILNIAFSLDKPAEVNLKIVNTLGETVWDKNEGMISKGNHSLSVDTKTINLAGGIYFITLSNGEKLFHKKIVLE